MPAATYLIVGGGMAADAAVRGIREVDQNSSIVLIGAEADPPYKRPPLSKGLWTGKSIDQIWSRTGNLGVELHLGRTVQALDRARKEVVDDRGQRYSYDRLLLATGSTPRHLPFDDSGSIVYFRSISDYRRLRALADQGQRFAVIGGGFIGSELAAALAGNGKNVTLIFPGQGIGDRLFPLDLALSLNDYYRVHGVKVLAGYTVERLDRRENDLVLRLRDKDTFAGREIAVDGVVAGVGAAPNVELVRSAGLQVGDGILLDAFLRTSDPDIYAAGDVANVWMPALHKRGRVEHEDNAKAMGRHAGRAMAGMPEPYDHLPFFYSDMFEMGYEAVGELDSRLDTVAGWIDPFREGTVYYMRENRVRGVLLWNVWDRVEAARELIRADTPIGDRQIPAALVAAD
jgi:NADPH-dependent 2,4-dienoyl-CoA reductase/sulfur reductase-like enzyme